MEIQPNNTKTQKNREISPSEEFAIVVLVLVVTIIISIVYFFRFLPVELNCTRSPQIGLECSMERQVPFVRMHPVTIPEPLAAERNAYSTEEGRMQYKHRVEIRSKRYSRPILLLFTFDDKTAQRVLKEINDFLLRSDQASFSRVYP
ncbi:hypothetical protein C1752_06155 [Acaryochloris thomasi RCC1774]|uniref:Uncharacterized protein n=1 Tax=Acaryochloris thomasi RCC1774 TaxID=1764569 RepID=A0A2W1JJ54_9CYAN|nr:hypothetical protein [Acaryochloris thomasi]PZD71535.1 hypothetical protein C1752_06155 [Acaryochloris thomasi RCC1774]